MRLKRSIHRRDGFHVSQLDVSSTELGLVVTGKAFQRRLENTAVSGWLGAMALAVRSYPTVPHSQDVAHCWHHGPYVPHKADVPIIALAVGNCLPQHCRSSQRRSQTGLCMCRVGGVLHLWHELSLLLLTLLPPCAHSWPWHAEGTPLAAALVYN